MMRILSREKNKTKKQQQQQKKKNNEFKKISLGGVS